MKKYEEILLSDIYDGVVYKVHDKYYEIKSKSYNDIFYMNKYLSYKKKLNIGDNVRFSVCDKRIEDGIKFISVSCIEYSENNKIIRNIGKIIKAKIIKTLDTGVILLLNDYQVCFMAYSSLSYESKEYDYKKIKLIGMSINVYIHSMYYIYGVHVSRKHSKIIRFRYSEVILRKGAYLLQYKEKYQNISFSKMFDKIDTIYSNKKILYVFKNYLKKQTYNIFTEPIGCHFSIDAAYYDIDYDKDNIRKKILSEFIDNFDKYYNDYILINIK
ncbi:hypothetical protein M0Q50_03480 [bacterium]|jgi:hypothetical protein|nr:hypothetical protein [bacterium]